MKIYNAPQIKVAEVHHQPLLSGSVKIVTKPVDPSTALSKDFEFIYETKIENSDAEDEE